MKKLLASFVCLAGLAALSAMADPGTIRLAKATIDTSRPMLQSARLATPVCSPSKKGTRLYLVQPEKNFSMGEKGRLEEMGLRFDGHVPPNAYIVEATESQIENLKNEFSLLYCGEYLPEYKLLQDSYACQVASFGNGESKSLMAVVVIREEFFQDVWQALLNLGAKDLERLPYHDPAIRVFLSPDQAREIAARGDVAVIEPYEDPKICNDVARSYHTCNVDVLQIKGYYGKGQMICVQDTGLDNGDTNCIHPDFLNKKVMGRNTTSVANRRGTYNDWHDAGTHGTHVSGTTCGTGLASGGKYAGMAREADHFCLCAGLTSGGIGAGNDADLQNTYDQGCRVMNNSWGSGSGGYYSGTSAQYDRIIWNNKDYTICFASGNNNSNPGLPSVSTLMSASSAKNIITVGASETYHPDYASDCNPDDGIHQGMGGFSSRGPCKDGRIKPDIVAPGTGVNSTWCTQTNTSVRSKYYATMGGTSMASPVTAGCCAVIRDYLTRNRHVASPSASLVKAVLLAGARTLYPGQYAHFPEIPQERPNNVEGHGHVNVQESLEPVDGKMEFAEFAFSQAGQSVTNYFEMESGHDLRVVLAWTDYPGDSRADIMLVNDLDLVMIDPNGRSYCLSNHLDNVESFRLGDAPAGKYTLIVHAATIMEGPQDASLVFNYGNGNRPGKIALHEMPRFKIGQDYCDIIVTNLVPGSYISTENRVVRNTDGVFSFSTNWTRFARSAVIRLKADFKATENDYPTCNIRIGGGCAGAIETLIGAPNGSKENGYVLYRADYREYPYKDVFAYDPLLGITSDAKGAMDWQKPQFFDQVMTLDFEEYPLDESVIGKNGWTLGYGKATNGTAIVRQEITQGLTNKYLNITCNKKVEYAPHLKISGIAKGWESARAHRYYKISFKVRFGGEADKAFSLWNPAIAENKFTRGGGGYCLETTHDSLLYPKFVADAYFNEEVWKKVELWVEADPMDFGGVKRHVLRHVAVDDVGQDCEGVYAQSNAGDIFAAMRFFQWGEGHYDVDDLCVERYVSDIEEAKSLKAETSMTSADQGLSCNIDMPEGLDNECDLVVKATFMLDGATESLVMGQDEDSRQFQSEIRQVGGEYCFYLTDYVKNPQFLKDTMSSNMAFLAGYRVNCGSAKKMLLRLFSPGGVSLVDDELTSTALSKSTAVKALRFCLPKAGNFKILSLEAAIRPIEKAKLCLAPKNFMAGSSVATWVLTNATPWETIQFSAAITGKGKNFAVSPTNGTFTTEAALEIRALNPSDDRGYEWGEIKIDAGEAGVASRIFGHQLGNGWNGYVLYDDATSPEGLVTVTNALWSNERTMKVSKLNEGGEDFLRIERLRTSSLTFDDQGAFLHIGAPMGHSTNLNFHVTGEIRFPNDFKGYFYLTQDEDHRQFQTSFSSVSSGSAKQVKVTLTDYTRNTNLINERLATGVWQPFDLLINALPSKKVLEEITVGKTTKVEGQKIGGQKVKKPDEILKLRFNLTYADQAVDIKNLKVTLDNPVPEPFCAGLLMVLIILTFRRLR